MTLTSGKPATGSVPVSVIIAATNEALHIERCVRHVEWAGDVFVVDGGSTDRTAELAQAAGATVVAHAWSGYARQKNWALENLPLRHNWVLFLDADEIVSPELAQEIGGLLEAVPPPQYDAFFVSERLVFLGRWLKHVWWYPHRTIRLVRRDRGGAFEERSVHERWLSQGAVGLLRSDLIHENLKPLHEYMERLNRYSTLEALEMTGQRAGVRSGQLKPNFFGDWAERRRALKVLVWYRLPFRSLIRLAWMWILRLGFLDGREGWMFTKLHVCYEMQISLKLKELELHRGNVEFLRYVATRLPGTDEIARALETLWMKGHSMRAG